MWVTFLIATMVRQVALIYYINTVAQSGDFFDTFGCRTVREMDWSWPKDPEKLKTQKNTCLFLL